MDYLSSFNVTRLTPTSKHLRKNQLVAPQGAYEMVRTLEDPSREKIIVFHMLPTMEIALVEVLSLGETDFSQIDVREIFKTALRTDTWGFVVIHTRATGVPIPSVADQGLIRKLKAQAEIMAIHFVDFLITAEAGFWSMREPNQFLP